MQQHASDADLDQLSWHDDTIYGFRFDVGDSFQGDWHADLVLDIDHIVEWICATDCGARFRVAPATLTFHGVTDLRIAIDWGDSGHRNALHELSIGAIAREPVPNQEGYPSDSITAGGSSSTGPRAQRSASAPTASPRSCAPSRCCSTSSG